jgi:ribosomal protein L22
MNCNSKRGNVLGLKLTKAYSYLSDVKDHKRVIPFRRFSGGVGRASQAKEFKATQGALHHNPDSTQL